MPDLTKTIVLKAFDGSEITVTFDSFVSQWHSEQMSDAYTPYYQYYDKEKGKIDVTIIPPEEKLKLGRARDARLIELFVKKWTVADVQPTVENVKKQLSAGEFDKLIKAIEAVYGDFDAEKKTDSPSNSSPASTPSSSQTVQSTPTGLPPSPENSNSSS